MSRDSHIEICAPSLNKKMQLTIAKAARLAAPSLSSFAIAALALGVRYAVSATSARSVYNPEMSQKNIDIDGLDPEDRLLLIERLWDSLDDSEASFVLAPAQQRELDSRLDRIDAGDDAGIPWEEFMSQLKSRLD